mgnify:CR=1 FL=1
MPWSSNIIFSELSLFCPQPVNITKGQCNIHMSLYRFRFWALALPITPASVARASVLGALTSQGYLLPSHATFLLYEYSVRHLWHHVLWTVCNQVFFIPPIKISVSLQLDQESIKWDGSGASAAPPPPPQHIYVVFGGHVNWPTLGIYSKLCPYNVQACT